MNQSILKKTVLGLLLMVVLTIVSCNPPKPDTDTDTDTDTGNTTSDTIDVTPIDITPIDITPIDTTNIVHRGECNGKKFIIQFKRPLFIEAFFI